MTELLLDYDGRLPRRLVERITAVGKLCRWGVQAVSFKRTRRGWHVQVLCRARLQPFAIVAAQAILGSDLDREMFNLMRASVLHVAPAFWRQRGRWNTFYSRKLP